MSDRSVSNPERIRALAHPTRLALLDVLGEVEAATATECAERTGESVASCSFHLRMLHKYGYVEPAPRRGREKPWRAVHEGFNLEPSPDEPGSLPAVAEVARLYLHREAERIDAFFAQASREEPHWIDTTTLTRTAFWATAEELAEVTKELHDVVGRLQRRFEGRDKDPSQRPDGARQGRMFAVVNPEPMRSGVDGAVR